MSILLNGLSMPENTFYIQIRIYDGGLVTVDINGEEAQIAEAIAIPSHGRLIDADALEASCFMGSSSFYTQSDIDYAPTVIPADKEKPCTKN